MTDLIADLIASLEAATEGSRELSTLLAELEGWVHQPDIGHNFQWRDPEGISRSDYPHYTTNLTAALTLVPDALTKKPSWWGIRRGGLTFFHGWIGNIDPYEDDCPTGFWAHAATPALALCIAALKARAILPGL